MIQIEPNEKVLIEVENVWASDKLLDLKRIGDMILTNKRVVWEGKVLGLAKKRIELKLNEIIKVEKMMPGIKSIGITLHTKDSKYNFVSQSFDGHVIGRMLKKHYTGKEPSLIELGEKIKELI